MIKSNFYRSSFAVMKFKQCKFRFEQILDYDKPPNDFYFFDLSKIYRLDKLCQKYEYDGSDQTDD